ncbi:vir protein [Legionella nautarum]|uniref:Vir protein n=1 Tax=Legionella nautarum TaxID=45070 RepID=A0A0W0WIP4_9GAMM|nr:type IV secretion system protein [Legionella nautarum]KTD32199.1 vir protein [Legionella nautarum]
MTITNPINTQDETYFQEARSWYEDIYTIKEKQITLYRMLCMGLFALLSLSLVGLTSLITREKVQPFLALVDKRTGEVTTPTRLNSEDLKINWKMVRFWVTTYINNRESYNFLNINEPYHRVIAMSNDKVGTQVDKELRPDLNAKSPIVVLGKHHYVTVTIHSINKLNKDHLLDIRFTTNTIDCETHKVVRSNEWRTTMKWLLLNKKRSLDEWDKNPLGFTVIFYDKQPIVA